MTQQKPALRKRIDSGAALAALHDLFFIVERLDIMAHNPPPNGMVQVTAIMWRDQISPKVRVVREALDAS